VSPEEVAAHLLERSRLRYSPASGPGGQHRDHTESRAELVVPAAALEGLPDDIAARLLDGLHLRGHPLRIASQADRSRERNRQIVIGTNQGQGIRFSETDVRPMGRDTTGAKGIAGGNSARTILTAVAATPVASMVRLIGSIEGALPGPRYGGLCAARSAKMQKRGIFRKENEGTTSREDLGLPGPKITYSGPNRRKSRGF